MLRDAELEKTTQKSTCRIEPVAMLDSQIPGERIVSSKSANHCIVMRCATVDRGSKESRH